MGDRQLFGMGVTHFSVVKVQITRGKVAMDTALYFFHTTDENLSKTGAAFVRILSLIKTISKSARNVVIK